MTALAHRPWVSPQTETLVGRYAVATARAPSSAIAERIERLAARRRALHERDCFNLDPASGVMLPEAERLLCAGLGTRGLHQAGSAFETVEEIEVIAAELTAGLFGGRYVELRAGSGVLATLAAFMAICAPGDAIIVPPVRIGGLISHSRQGAAGLFGLEVHEMPVDQARASIDLERLAEMAWEVRPELITLGGRLALFPEPVREAAAIAEDVGARLLVDASHSAGPVAGGVWPNPLGEGADCLVLATDRSLGGPPGGLVVTDDPALAEKIEAIVSPGLTVRFDAARTAALAITLLDWREQGTGLAERGRTLATALADALADREVPVLRRAGDATASHQIAVEAEAFGGGHAACRRLQSAGFLASPVGLPRPGLPGEVNGIRLSTTELARIGVEPADLPHLADLFALALDVEDPAALAEETRAFRHRFGRLQETA